MALQLPENLWSVALSQKAWLQRQRILSGEVCSGNSTKWQGKVKHALTEGSAGHQVMELLEKLGSLSLEEAYSLFARLKPIQKTIQNTPKKAS